MILFFPFIIPLLSAQKFIDFLCEKWYFYNGMKIPIHNPYGASNQRQAVQVLYVPGPFQRQGADYKIQGD